MNQQPYFVLGYDEHGRVVFMTHREFADSQAAHAYARTCAAGWRAFVVGRVST
jgi:hypothetical protein